MHATAHSSTINNTNPTISPHNNDALSAAPWPPNKDNNKWPATMLAANRTANAPGRIKFLIVSIITITGIRTAGVPTGTRWTNIFLYWNIIDHKIQPIQNGNARDSVNLRWLELVKIYGNSPKKFEKIINKKNLIKLKILPNGTKLPNTAVNSATMPFIMRLVVIVIWFGANQ